MCNHKSQIEKYDYLADYYSASYEDVMAEVYTPRYHENAFDHLPGAVVTAGKPDAIQLFNWGMIPYWVKSLPDALRMRASTVNCISEEMFDKASFRDAANNNQRCLIPTTGFFEWQHLNNGKV